MATASVLVIGSWAVLLASPFPEANYTPVLMPNVSIGMSVLFCDDIKFGLTSPFRILLLSSSTDFSSAMFFESPAWLILSKTIISNAYARRAPTLLALNRRFIHRCNASFLFVPRPFAIPEKTKMSILEQSQILLLLLNLWSLLSKEWFKRKSLWGLKRRTGFTRVN